MSDEMPDEITLDMVVDIVRKQVLEKLYAEDEEENDTEGRKFFRIIPASSNDKSLGLYAETIDILDGAIIFRDATFTVLHICAPGTWKTVFLADEDTQKPISAIGWNE